MELEMVLEVPAPPRVNPKLVHGEGEVFWGLLGLIRLPGVEPQLLEGPVRSF